jgi:ABC-type Na+ transport system ATPase subunit NatA
LLDFVNSRIGTVFVAEGSAKAYYLRILLGLLSISEDCVSLQFVNGKRYGRLSTSGDFGLVVLYECWFSSSVVKNS